MSLAIHCCGVYRCERSSLDIEDPRCSWICSLDRSPKWKLKCGIGFVKVKRCTYVNRNEHEVTLLLWVRHVRIGGGQCLLFG